MNKRNVALAVILVLVAAVLYGGQLKGRFFQPSPEKLTKVLQEKGTKLKVTSPGKDAKIKSNFTISGTAKVPGQYLRAIINDAKGNLLVRKTITMPKSLDWEAFSIPMQYTGSYRGKAEVEVYWLNNLDLGSRTDVTKIPVNLE